MTHPLTDPVALLRALLAANWQRLLASAPDPDERDEDAIAHLDASRWLDAAALRATGDASAPTPAEQRADAREREVELERLLTTVTRERDDRTATLAATGLAVAALAYGAPVNLTGVSALVADALPRLTADLAATRSELTATVQRADAAARGLLLLRAAVGGIACPTAAVPVDRAELLALVGEVTVNALDAIIARIDAQPAQREASGGAGVDWRTLHDNLLARLDRDVAECEEMAASYESEPRRASAVRTCARDIRDIVASARDAAREAQRSADEAHQGGERVGEVVVREGSPADIASEVASCGHVPFIADLYEALREYGGRRVRVVVEVLDGAGHGASVATSASVGEGP